MKLKKHLDKIKVKLLSPGIFGIIILKQLVPERGLHIPQRIRNNELFPLPMDENSRKQNSLEKDEH